LPPSGSPARIRATQAPAKLAVTLKNKRVQWLDQLRRGAFQFRPWSARQRGGSPRQNGQYSRLIFAHTGRYTFDAQAHRLVSLSVFAQRFIFNG